MLLRIRDVCQSDGRISSTFFIGEDSEHTLQNAGSLVLTTGEWQLLGAALLLGAEQTHGHLVIELPDSKRITDELARTKPAGETE